MRVKRYLGILATALCFLFLLAGSSWAVQGACVNCHTMHNSQNGQPMAKVYSSGSLISTSTPNEYLLRGDCIACHADDSANSETNSFGAPVVFHLQDPGGQGYQKTLAGGDFYWVYDTTNYGDAYGHNVAGIAGQDGSLGYQPPGFDPNATPGANSDGQINGGNSTWSTQLTCAGTNGCHGTHDKSDALAAIKGAHHSNAGGQLNSATTLGTSYRFLSGIYGYEDSDWNYNETSSVHNEYYGVNDTNLRNQTNTTYSDKHTISYFCAECHGYFHSRIDNDTQGSPWLRHPTDIALPNSGEYANYNDGNGYSILAPVARSTVPTSSSSTVTPGTDIVMCLSCHRAHGSNQPDLLRWDYSTCQAGTANPNCGCFVCHTTKD